MRQKLLLSLSRIIFDFNPDDNKPAAKQGQFLRKKLYRPFNA